MSRHHDLIEAQLIASLHDELDQLDKQASAVITGAKAGGKLLPKVVKGVKGSKTLAKYGPKAWGKFLKSVPGRIGYRMTGYKGPGWNKLTKAQQAERMRSIGVRGVEGVEGAKKEMLEEAGKHLEGDKILGKKTKQRLEALKAQKGSLETASPEELAKALGGKGDTLLAEGQAYEKGITSVPGYLRAAAKDPLGTARLGWRTEGTTGKAMTAGFGTLGAYNVATAKPEDRLSTLAEELPATALYAVTGPTGFMGQLALADVPTSIAASAVRRAQAAKNKAKVTPALVHKAKTIGQPKPGLQQAVSSGVTDAVRTATPGITRPTARAHTVSRFAHNVAPKVNNEIGRLRPNPKVGV